MAADAAANTRRWADYEASQTPTPAPVAGVQDIEPDVNVGSTQWEVYDRSTGNPVFRMYAADQAEAWRKGQEWVANYARMTPDQPIDPADYSVRQGTAVTESITVLEQRLRQQLDALGNQAPTGPETPPKMPDGTIKVDVSDMYDWYKLGQHISDLKSIDKSTLGKGPPSTVFAFGSEELENKYSHELMNLGLKTHDLDEPGEEDVDESEEITKLGKLDSVLEKCIEMIRRGHETNPDKYGRVAACLIDNKNNHTYAINMPGPDGTRRHAERMAIDKHLKSHGRIGPNAIMITTLSPCVNHMDERYGESCTDLLSDYGIEKCYAGWQDPTQHPAEDYPFNLKITDRADIFNTCRDIAASFLPQAMAEAYTGPQMKFLRPGELSGSYSPQQMQAMGFKQSVNGSWYIPMNMWQRLVSGGQIKENFADGKNPQDKGDSKRHGINTRASVSSLRKTAKSGGRKGQLAHWLANMKAGRAKAKRKTNEAVDQQTVANFTTRVQFALAKIEQNTDPKYPDHREFVQLIAANKVNIMNGNPSNTAFSSGWDLNMDAEEFHDAPIEVLILVMAHEIGHIIYGHTFRDPKLPPLTVPQEQQEEYAADQFAINIMKRLGIQKVPVWTWLRRKKNDLEQFKQRQDAAPPGSWPTFNQRSDRARKLGVELTKINTDQIDQALQHMA
jgi:pyrimidine deaminase RibD-like protein